MVIKVIKAAFTTEAERLAKLVVNSIGARLETEARNLFFKAEIHFSQALQKHAADQAARFSKIKTLFTEGRLVDLDPIYVQQKIRWGKETIDEVDLPSRLLTEKRIIITGIAGTGKSLFLKQLFRHLSSDVSRIYPAFVELRALKGRKYPDLLSYVATTLSTRKHPLTREHIQIAIEERALALLLDGFDEIDFDVRPRYEQEILEVAGAYKNAVIAVTSRNDPQRFETWSEFNEVSVLPLSHDQTIELITKLGEDSDLKDKFIDRAKKELFRTHGTFLSNPLLAGMMLITFKRIADIPTKRHIFYREAFAALYERHDASKGGQYARKRYAALDVDSFTGAFATFSFLTYADGILSMSEKMAIKYINDSFDLEECEAAPKDFLQDLLESVCILLRDGDQIIFTHRSFQEYFCAVFVAGNRSGDQYEILTQLASRGPEDNVLSLIMGINSEFLEREWVMPSVERLLSLYDDLSDAEKLSGFLGGVSGEVAVFMKEPSFSYTVGRPLGWAIFYLGQLYPDHFANKETRATRGSRIRVRERLKELGLWSKGRGVSKVFAPKKEHEALLNDLNVGAWLDTLVQNLRALQSELRARYKKREVSLRELLAGKGRLDNGVKLLEGDKVPKNGKRG